MSFLGEVGTTVESLQCKLEQEDISQQQYNSAFRGLGEMVKSAIRVLDQLAPQPRPIGFQTTDAGPDVGTSETMVCLRMAESFVWNDLDIQIRAQYAPRD